MTAFMEKRGVDGLADGKTITEVCPMIVAMGGLYRIVNLLAKGIFTIKSIWSCV